VSARQLVNPMMMGFAANNLLPLRAGELIRVYTAGESLRVPKTQVLASLVVERLFDTLSIALIVIAGLAALAFSNDSLAESRTLLATALAALVLMLALLYGLLRAGNSLPEWLHRWLPERVRTFVVPLAEQFSAGIEPLKENNRIPIVLFNSVLQWLGIVVCIHLSIMAAGIDGTTMSASMIALGIIALSISVPSAPGFIGAIEFAFVFALGIFEIDPSTALAAAVFYHVLSFAYVMLTGALCYAAHQFQRR